MRFRFSILSLLVSFALFAQEIVFIETPAQLQLYPRDSKDSGLVIFTGKVTTTSYDSIIIKMYVNNVFNSRRELKLNYDMENKAFFTMSLPVHADTVLYKFEVLLRNGGGLTLKKTIDSVVCGDIFLIDGQSNAVASNGGAKTTDKFLRSFGKQCEWDAYNPADTTWGLAWNGAPGYFGVGAWGYEMMRLLKNQFGVPIAIINGAGSGSNIESHKKNIANPLNLASNAFYGKLLYRAKKAHVADKVKAILWHQGEADIYAPEFWVANFKMLINSWKTDYPSLSQVYFYQIHQGCTFNNNTATWGEGIGASKFREWQRNLPDSLPICRIMSTMGIPEHDGCHYAPIGYKTMGFWMYRLMARDYYNHNFGIDVSAPNIKKAFYTNGSRTEIALLFKNNQQVVWTESIKNNGVDRFMKDYFYLNGKGKVVDSHRMNNDTLFLILKAASSANKITYLPDNIYGINDFCYEGPWIMGTNGVGLLSFFEVPVTCANNNYPTIKQKTITLSKYTPIGTIVDTAKGTDPDGNNLFYSITGGNTDNSFSIDSVTGVISVQKPLAAAKYYLGLKVRDDGVCNLSATTTNIINYPSYSLPENAGEELTIYPNPSDGTFELSCIEDFIGNIIISVTDLSGREVYKKIEYKNEPVFKKRIQINASYGMYLVKISLGDKMITGKMIIK